MSETAFPSRIKAAEFADLIKRSHERVRQLSHAELLPKIERGTLPFRAALEAWFTYLEKGKGNAKLPASGDPDELNDKDRKLKAEADLAEMEAAQQKGLLVNGPALKAALGQRDIAVKDRLLAVPMAAAHRALEASETLGVEGVAEVYKREITAALEDLASSQLVAAPDA